MSQKIAQFASYLTQPLNVYNFEIAFVKPVGGGNVLEGVDGFNNPLLYVQSASFPKEELQYMTLNYKGEEIQYPAKPKIGGDWTITIPEGDGGQVRKSLDKLKHNFYDQSSGAITPRPWFNIVVIQKDLQDNVVFKCVLVGCWLKGRNENQLKTENVTENWTNTYTFRYTYIQDNPNAKQGNLEYVESKDKTFDPFTGE